jgi:hypothetical protein
VCLPKKSHFPATKRVYQNIFTLVNKKDKDFLSPTESYTLRRNDAPPNTEGYMIAKILFYCAGLCWLLSALVFSGCAGLEVGGKFGVYAVDDRQETQVTKSRARPLRCLWSGDAPGCQDKQ